MKPLLISIIHLLPQAFGVPIKSPPYNKLRLAPSKHVPSLDYIDPSQLHQFKHITAEQTSPLLSSLRLHWLPDECFQDRILCSHSLQPIHIQPLRHLTHMQIPLCSLHKTHPPPLLYPLISPLQISIHYSLTLSICSLPCIKQNPIYIFITCRFKLLSLLSFLSLCTPCYCFDTL